MRLTEEKILSLKNRLKKVANNFGFKYDPVVFKVSFLSKKDFTLLNYLTGCPDTPYSKFGKTKTERLKRINEFLSSKDFANQIKKSGGCVVTLKTLQYVSRRIKNKKIEIRWKKLVNKIRQRTKFGLAVITEPADKKEFNFTLNNILFHEWVHVLLTYNKINFQKIKHSFWLLDEGLTTYLQIFSENEKVDLEKRIKSRIKRKGTSKLFKLYAKNALTFNVLLKNKKYPKERYKAIINFIKNKKEIGK